MARFGQLYLQDGRWNSTEVVPRDWVRDSLRQHSDLGDGTGYGYLWWTYAGSSLTADHYPALAGRDIVMTKGTGGQALFLIPSADMVVVHRADTDHGRSVPGPAIWNIVDRLVGARTGSGIASPRVQPMQAVPLASQAPAPAAPKLVSLDVAALGRFAGDYVMAQGGVVRVFMYDRRLFVNVPGEGEAELFATGPTTFTVFVISGVSAEFAEGPDGRVARLTLRLGRQVIEAARR
jgi:CubicO group peptidase (beta-lactamase class C family)